MITLHGMGSPNVLKVVVMLEELGLAYERRHISVFKAEQFNAEFQAISPLGKVPVLVEGETTVFESGAILIYLAETRRALLPASGPARYDALKWLMLQMANVGPMFGQLNHFMLMPQPQNAYALTRYREQSLRLYRTLDQRLAASPFLGGEDYSIADIAVWPWARYVDRHKLDWAAYPALKAWVDMIAARPAVVRALESIAEFRSLDAAEIKDATPEQLDRFFWREGSGPAPDFSSMR